LWPGHHFHTRKNLHSGSWIRTGSCKHRQQLSPRSPPCFSSIPLPITILINAGKQETDLLYLSCICCTCYIYVCLLHNECMHGLPRELFAHMDIFMLHMHGCTRAYLYEWMSKRNYFLIFMLYVYVRIAHVDACQDGWFNIQ
jgi:hypothetical protein